MLCPESQERKGVLIEYLDPFRHGIGGIVRTFDETLSREGTEVSGKIRLKALACRRVDLATREPLYRLLSFEVKEYDEVVREYGIEEGFLSARSRNPIEENLIRSMSIAVVFEHRGDEIVRDELSLLHMRPDLARARMIEF